MWIRSRSAALLPVVAAVCAACGGGGPVAPSSAAQAASISAPQATHAANPQASAVSIPPLSGPSRVFVFAHESTEQVRDYTRSSSFVLFDDGAFVLKYPSGEYHGAYTVANDIVTFEWEGWSLAGPWGATGTLDGDTLTVQYNTVMDLSDFENAAYVLAATNQNP